MKHFSSTIQSCSKRSVSHPSARQQGMSLIELMIAMALGLFLMWGAMQAYLTSKRTYSMQQSLSRIQETGRMAHEFIGFDARNAGNTGCASANLKEVLIQRPAPPAGATGSGCEVAASSVYTPLGVTGSACNGDGVSMLTGFNAATGDAPINLDFSMPVYGVNDVDGSATAGQNISGGNLNPAPKKDTDLLVLKGGAVAGAALSNTANSTDAKFQTTMVSNDGGGCFNGICPGDIVAVSDCVKAKIFQATAVTANQINVSASGLNQCNTWGSPATAPEFAPGSQVMKMNTAFYYVADNADKIPTLYKREATGASVELLQGVEDIQVEYGVGKNVYAIDNLTKTPILYDHRYCNNARLVGSVLTGYKTANLVTQSEWDAWDGDDYGVVAVRYSLLVRGEDAVLDEPQKYTFNGKNYTGGVLGATASATSDKRLRQIFTSTITVRNLVRQED